MNPESTALEAARNSLAKIWFIGSGFVFLLLVVQSILGKYETSLQEVWAWFVPTVLPTLALMLGVIGAGALMQDQDKRKVKAFFFSLSKYLSLFYLLILSATILLEPFSNTPGIKLYNLSNYWLGPIQGLVVGAISVLFASQDKDASVVTPPG